MAKATAQQVHALTTYFISKHTEVVGSQPLVNRNKCRWWFESMLNDYTPSEVRELIDYYVEHWQAPTVEWFCFNYEKVDQAKQEHEQDKIILAARRKATEQRLNEWRERWKKS